MLPFPYTRLVSDEWGPVQVDIAGNDKITLTYRDSVGAPIVAGKEIIRENEIIGMSSGSPVLKDRITIEVNVSDVALVYRLLNTRGITIDHFYDY